MKHFVGILLLLFMFSVFGCDNSPSKKKLLFFCDSFFYDMAEIKPEMYLPSGENIMKNLKKTASDSGYSLVTVILKNEATYYEDILGKSSASKADFIILTSYIYTSKQLKNLSIEGKKIGIVGSVANIDDKVFIIGNGFETLRSLGAEYNDKNEKFLILSAGDGFQKKIYNSFTEEVTKETEFVKLNGRISDSVLKKEANDIISDFPSCDLVIPYGKYLKKIIAGNKIKNKIILLNYPAFPVFPEINEKVKTILCYDFASSFKTITEAFDSESYSDKPLVYGFDLKTIMQ